MTAKQSAKPYWQMNAGELAEATKEFDVEFVADKARSLTPAMRARWARAKMKRASARNGATDQIIAVRVEKQLLERCASHRSPGKCTASGR